MIIEVIRIKQCLPMVAEVIRTQQSFNHNNRSYPIEANDFTRDKYDYLQCRLECTCIVIHSQTSNI